MSWQHLDVKAIALSACGALMALDCLFKAHYGFWVGYSMSIELLMEFIQKVLYKIEITTFSSRVHELHNSV